MPEVRKAYRGVYKLYRGLEGFIRDQGAFGGLEGLGFVVCMRFEGVDRASRKERVYRVDRV